LAVELERFLHRDGRTLDEALPVLQARYPETTRQSLEELMRRLPERHARRRMVDLEEADDVPIEESTEENVLQAERRTASQRLSNAMRDALAGLDPRDRLLLQLRFESRMRGPQIARSMHIEQKLLYRRLEKLLRDLRAELERAGIDRREIADLIGHEGADLDFVLGTPALGPSTMNEGSVAAQGEVSR
jgi:DNA-directed RNA polymerase specialized sigma subunit